MDFGQQRTDSKCLLVVRVARGQVDENIERFEARKRSDIHANRRRIHGQRVRVESVRASVNSQLL